MKPKPANNLSDTPSEGLRPPIIPIGIRVRHDGNGDQLFLPVIPILYLRGISSGDFQEALSALLGKDAPNLSPAVLGRLKATWKEEFDRRQQRDLSARRYVYIWADGVYLQARMEAEKQCPWREYAPCCATDDRLCR